MNYRTIVQLNQAIRGSLQQLPWAPEVVAGVHKSGMMAATQFSLYFNVPAIPLCQLWMGADWVYAGKRTYLEDQHDYLLKPRRILVVEDSVGSGATAQREFKKLRDRHLAPVVPHEFFFLAVYGVKKNVPAFDLIIEVCPGPRMFEWNWLNNSRLGRAILDIDGVLCKDPPFIEDQTPHTYQKYLANAVPLFIPKIPVMALATSRLEKFRPETEDWLARTGVKYSQLHMAQFKTAPDRRRHGNYKTKAEVYARMKKARLFIESNNKQAKLIHQATKKLVFCVESGVMYGAKG